MPYLNEMIPELVCCVVLVSDVCNSKNVSSDAFVVLQGRWLWLGQVKGFTLYSRTCSSHTCNPTALYILPLQQRECLDAPSMQYDAVPASGCTSSARQ